MRVSKMELQAASTAPTLGKGSTLAFYHRKREGAPSVTNLANLRSQALLHNPRTLRIKRQGLKIVEFTHLPPTVLPAWDRAQR